MTSFDRSRFGTWGIELDDDDFARALAVAGVMTAMGDLGLPKYVTPEDALLRIDRRGGTVYPWRINDFPRLPPAEPGLWQEWLRKVARPIRLEIRDTPPDPALVSMLVRPDIAADAGYFRRDDPPAPVSWQWPLRVGVFDDERGAVLREALSGSSMRPLVEFVTLSPAASECDLLLLPYNLRSSLQRVLAAPFRIQADCVIVVGGAKVADERLESLISALRAEVLTAGVAVAAVPKEKRRWWFHSLIAELSHDYTIDVALAIAARNQGLAAPLVVCSSALAEFARLSNFVERMGRALQLRHEVRVLSFTTRHRGFEAPALPFELGGGLVRHARDFEYEHESDEANAVVQLRGDAHQDAPLIIPPVFPQAAPAPAAMPEAALERHIIEKRPKRSVQARFYQVPSGGPATVIERDSAYLVGIRIAPPDRDWVVATKPLDESVLPPSPTGHDLTIALVELRDGVRAPLTAPQQQTIHLPPAGPSQEAHFRVKAAAAGVFVARVIVLYQNRVLQTWILRAPLGEKATLIEENIVEESFQSLDQKRRFDAAIIVNDNDGVPGVTIAAGQSVDLLEPDGLDKAVGAIHKTISRMTSLAESDFTLDDPDVVKLLISLARHGKLLWDLFARKAERLLTLGRIQILEVREGAYLPVEYFYTSYAPADDATICPHGREALTAADVKPCPNAMNPRHVCPAVFWGFSKVLERRPHQEFDNRHEFQLSEPQKDRCRIDPWKGAVLGASKRVAAADVTGADGVLTVLKTNFANATQAADWTNWTEEISTSGPSLLILLPHTDQDPDEIARMEIGNVPLTVSMIEEPYVRQPSSEPGPIVLLLGCSTELTGIPFHNFVARFKIKGASLVLGTLSIIRGRHVKRFVKRFFEMLGRYKGGTFGDALLETKRAMLAEGDPFALTLVAYGDADWRI